MTRSRQVHFLGDAGFSSVKLLKGLDALGLTFTVGMRADRQMLGGKKIRDVTSQERHIELADLEGMELWLYWVWLPRADHGEPMQRFVITNRRRTSTTVRKTGRRRWKIEALFKTLKSRFAFGKFGQKTKLGVLRYLCLSVAAFLLCHFEQLDTQESGQEDPSWPDWGELARQVQAKLLGWVRLIQLDLERQRILDVWEGKTA